MDICFSLRFFLFSITGPYYVSVENKLKSVITKVQEMPVNVCCWKMFIKVLTYCKGFWHGSYFVMKGSCYFNNFLPNLPLFFLSLVGQTCQTG